MKQGTTRRQKPKDKHNKKSWQTRNEARADKQAAFELAVQKRQEEAADLQDAIDLLPVKTSDYYRDPNDPAFKHRPTESYFEAMMDIANEEN